MSVDAAAEMQRCKALHEALQAILFDSYHGLTKTHLMEYVMEMQMIGPLGKVTGSCTWLRDTERQWNFLVDCGMQQGEQSAAIWNSGSEWPFDPTEIQFVALTHAHIDHCGLIPELYRRGFSGPVYCTPTTRKLSQALLADAARLGETPYSASDIESIKWRDDRIDRLGGYHPVATDLFLRFFRSGHIVGATSICVLWGAPGTEQRSIVFSGDVGPGAEDNETLPFLRFPMHPKPADYAARVRQFTPQKAVF